MEFGIQSRLEATSIRESTLAFRPGKHVTRPLDVFRAVEAELLRSDRTLNSYPSVRLSEAEKIMLHFRCISEECKQYVLLHGKSDTLEQLLESIKVFDSHLRLISYEKESTHAKSFWNEDTLAAFNKGKGKKGKDSKGKGKKGEKGKDSKGKGKKKEKEGKGKGGDSKGAASKVKCFNWDEVGHFARDCPHPKKEKGAGASGQPKAKASPQPTITMMLVADTSGAPCFHQPLVSGEGSEVTNPFFGDLPSPGFTDSEEEDHHAQDDFGLREDVFHELRDVFRGFEQEVFLDWHDCRVCICHGVDLEDLEQHDHGCIVAEQHHEQHELGQVATEQRREQHELGRFACMLGRSPPQEVVQLSSSFGCRQSRGESTLDPSLWDHLWLADSGASIHLIAESLLSTGHADLVDEDYHEVRCTLASGESLSLTRRVTVRARFLTASDSLVCCELTGVLVDNVHSLLSLGSLAAKGWTVTLSKQGFCVRRRQLKLFSYWGSNVGWRQVPLSSDSDAEQQGQEADMTKTAKKDQKEGPAEVPVRPLETDMPKTTAEGPEEERPRPAVKLVEAGTQTLESALWGEVPEPSNGVTNEPMETRSVVTEEPHPDPVDDSLNEEDSEELLALRRLRESVRKCVEGMHSHIATQIKEAAVKAMPRPAAKAVASKAMPKSGRKRGSVDKDPSSVDKEPKDLRRPSEPANPPSSSSKRVALVPRDQRVHRFPPPPRVPSYPKPPAVPKAPWPKGLPRPPPAPDAWV